MDMELRSRIWMDMDAVVTDAYGYGWIIVWPHGCGWIWIPKTIAKTLSMSISSVRTNWDWFLYRNLECHCGRARPTLQLYNVYYSMHKVDLTACTCTQGSLWRHGALEVK